MSESKSMVSIKRDSNGKSAALRRGISGSVWNLASESFPAMPIPKSLTAPNVLKFSRMVNTGTVLTTSVTLPTFASLNFTLNDLPEVASFQTLFDQYKIDLVEVWIYASYGLSDVPEAGQLLSVVDFDDSTNLGSVNAGFDYDNVIVGSLLNGHYRKFEPRAAIAAYSGAFTSYAQTDSNTWLDMASSTIQYYGVKLAAPATATALTIKAIARYHFSCRANRQIEYLRLDIAITTIEAKLDVGKTSL